GYRSGGSEINTARSLVVAFDPEYTWNTELSLRSVWLDGAARFNANLFHVDWTAQQVQVNLGLNTYDNQTVNAGKSRLSGFEAEWAHRVSPQFDYYANIGHVRTRFGAMSPREGQARYTLTGAEFPHAPRWTAAVGGTWRNGQGLMVNLNASHRTAMFDNAQNQSDPEARHKSRTLLNGRVGYETSLWGVFLDGSNLTNAKHSYYRDEKYGEVLGQPRRLSISLEARW
ncbi:MAG: TonB-dependent receptor domain-containing protein, partial [Asticcacaulis sp.]